MNNLPKADDDEQAEDVRGVFRLGRVKNVSIAYV